MDGGAAPVAAPTGDPCSALDEKYGIGGASSAATAAAPQSAPTPPASDASTVNSTASPDPYAALDTKYFGGGGAQQRTPAEQASDKEYGKQSTLGDIGGAVADAPVKALIGLLGLPGL